VSIISKFLDPPHWHPSGKLNRGGGGGGGGGGGAEKLIFCLNSLHYIIILHVVSKSFYISRYC